MKIPLTGTCPIQLQISSVTWYSKMHGLCHWGPPQINSDKGDGNCQALKDIDANCPEEKELVVEFIDPCWYFIYQFPDIAVDGPLNKMIREECHNHVAKLFSTSKQSASSNAGGKILWSQNNLVGFITNAYGKINTINRKSRRIIRFFQNVRSRDPWSDTTVRKRSLKYILKGFQNLECTVLDIHRSS